MEGAGHVEKLLVFQGSPFNYLIFSMVIYIGRSLILQQGSLPLIICSGRAACLLNEHFLITNKGKGNQSSEAINKPPEQQKLL